jgi:4-hydroxy-4-methyl-2-oxoglutarate aldolase
MSENSESVDDLDSEALTAALRGLHTALLADVLDQMGARVSFLGAAIRPVHPGIRTAGRALTLRTEPVERSTAAPYQGLLEVFPTIRPDDVLVLGGGETSAAGLWGGLLSTAARARSAAGVVVDGLTRDVDEIEQLGFPVFARGTSPLDSAGRQEVVDTRCPLEVGTGMVQMGDYVVGDSMGVIAFPSEAAEEAVLRAQTKSRGEATVQSELNAGADVRALFDRYGIL